MLKFFNHRKRNMLYLSYLDKYQISVVPLYVLVISRIEQFPKCVVKSNLKGCACVSNAESFSYIISQNQSRGGGGVT